ncbi:MAG: phenylalanine--tRNA ligase subunit beta [Syntrophaceticus sp.]|nr:phenylalanine--tRNA ligase subunit beta [Syntrophaceticus sp.]MDD4359888.1 phenylalanine--tRNA ligase subunit beta [Syntrophaceticus sp.]MDD4782863.1 phenylalanine--tRNA ligase subunit beta [Syntrophaceticus sp.]
MRVSYRWLQDYIKCELPVEELAEKLTMAGLEVEGVFPPIEGLDRIIAGRIMEIKPHPHAEHLMLCRVDTGSDTIQLVSGAPNLKAGACAALALPGVMLPGGRVEARDFRGESSEGMLCSGAELGTDQWGYGDDKGILLLDGEIPAGTKLDQAIELDDRVIEIELTPNRGDCQAVINIAREVKALTGAELHLPEPVVVEEDGLTEDYIKVSIEATDLCRRYACRLVRNIKLESSPLWMQQRLLSAGMRPINNIVDVTNYVMLEYGQPLHAFDFDKIQGSHIIVRRGHSGEKMVSLDGNVRDLDPEMLVIADEEEAVALAGVMGGLASEVTENTQMILLESAWFEPLSVRRTATRLGLHSEASRRFEKGINADGIIPAVNRAAQLIQQLGAGQITTGIVDVNVRPETARTIRLRTARVNKVLGTKLAREEIQELIERLDFPCELCSGDAILVTIPAYRVDIFEEVDLIEEVARLYGYDRITATYPVGVLIQDNISEPSIRDQVINAASGFGLDEVLTYSFTGEGSFDKLRIPQDSLLRNVLKIQNPLRIEQQVMRTTLLPGLMDAVTYNYHRKLVDLGLFEVGAVFVPQQADQIPEERQHLGIIACGKTDAGWRGTGEERDYYYVKGIIEGILGMLGMKELTFEKYTDFPALHPGRSARILYGQEELGYLGELHPQVMENYDLSLRAVVCELDLEKVALFSNQQLLFKPISRYPGINRDLALVVPVSVPAAQVQKVIYGTGGDLLKKCQLFDVYYGDQVPEGYRSLAYSLLYQSPDHTLTDEEVAGIHDAIIEALAKEVGAHLR